MTKDMNYWNAKWAKQNWDEKYLKRELFNCDKNCNLGHHALINSCVACMKVRYTQDILNICIERAVYRQALEQLRNTTSDKETYRLVQLALDKYKEPVGENRFWW